MTALFIIAGKWYRIPAFMRTKWEIEASLGCMAKLAHGGYHSMYSQNVKCPEQAKLQRLKVGAWLKELFES